MKTIAFLILGILLRSPLFGQDTIYTVSGEKQCVKVLEITSAEIKYKKTSNLDGPLYTVNKNNVALIEYRNGIKEVYGNASIAPQQNAADPNDPNQQNAPAVVNNNSNNNTYYGGGGYGYGGYGGPGVTVALGVGVGYRPFWGGFWGGYYGGGFYRHRGYYGGGRHYGHYGRRH